jgi:hypothetical protein
MRVRVFLRQSLFSLPAGPAPGTFDDAAVGHVPVNAAILTGTLVDQSGFGLTLRVEGYTDERGRALTGPARTLIVPSAKIDHVWVEG